MASKGPIPIPYFFIFDSYVMKESNDNNDTLPRAISYFYPDEQIKRQKLLEIGEIVGVVQYFQHDLFRSIARTLYFQKTFVVHKHFGRHSGFLCVPDDRYTAEEAHIYLNHILNVFNMLYGSWNHVQSTYEQDDRIYGFLQEALTPIVTYVFNQHRSISTVFSTIEYTLLKKGNQRVLLESKHYLGYLKSKYGLHDGFIGHDDKILYSTCNPDTTFYLQLLFQLTNELSENLITIPWESDFKLRTGVSIFRIYIRQPLIPKPTKKTSTNTKTNLPTNTKINLPTDTKTNIPTIRIASEPINIFDVEPGALSDCSVSSPKNFRHKNDNSSSVPDKNRLGVIIQTDPSGSSEETGFDTDTADELSPPSLDDIMTSSSTSLNEIPKYINTEASTSGDEEPKTDEQKLAEKSRSRSSTIENDIEKTIVIERKNTLDEPFHRIHLVQVDSFDSNTSDDDQGTFHIPNRTLSFDYSRERSSTISSDINDRSELQVSWKDIPDKNTEDERDELVLYIQHNSRMIFAGIFEQSLLTVDYLNKLWSLMLSSMANMEAEIQVISTFNEMIRLTTDVRFQFNENTRHAEFERINEGIRYSRRIPSEESTYMALFARTELNRNPERKVIGLSRGSHLVSIDRRLPDRIYYSCRRFQETS